MSSWVMLEKMKDLGALKKMKAETWLLSFWSLDYEYNGVNTKLTFWMHLTDETIIGGVFGSFHWFRDVPDSEQHFQGPKWVFTPFFF